MKVIIVGGVAGGASCAARLRRLDEKAEILMVERGPYVSYANCGLPYHVSGVIAEESSLLVATEQMFRAVFNVDARTRCEAIAIDAEEEDRRPAQCRDRRGDDRILRQAGAVARRGPDPAAASRHRPAGDLLRADRPGRPDHPRVAASRRGSARPGWTRTRDSRPSRSPSARSWSAAGSSASRWWRTSPTSGSR